MVVNRRPGAGLLYASFLARRRRIPNLTSLHASPGFARPRWYAQRPPLETEVWSIGRLLNCSTERRCLVHALRDGSLAESHVSSHVRLHTATGLLVYCARLRIGLHTDNISLNHGQEVGGLDSGNLGHAKMIMAGEGTVLLASCPLSVSHAPGRVCFPG